MPPSTTFCLSLIHSHIFYCWGLVCFFYLNSQLEKNKLREFYICIPCYFSGLLKISKGWWWWLEREKGDAEENKEGKVPWDTQTAQDDALAMWKSKSIILSAIFPCFCCCCFSSLSRLLLLSECSTLIGSVWFSFLLLCVELKKSQKNVAPTHLLQPLNRTREMSAINIFVADFSWCRSHLRVYCTEFKGDK